MQSKLLSLGIVLVMWAVSVRGQESMRELTESGGRSKLLTPGQLDRWTFDGEKGETIIARVVSNSFDPVLELVKTTAKDDDRVLVEVDDPGNESRFSIRLPEKGQYRIRVHAFKNQGGGNYSIHVQRFQAKTLAVGKPTVGNFGDDGKSYHYLQTAKDQILVPDLIGASSGAWKLLDAKGHELESWAGAVLIREAGECYLVASGQPEFRYSLLVREARKKDLAIGKEISGSLQQGELEVLSFTGQPGDFRLLELEKKGALTSRLIYAPPDKKSEQRISRAGERPELEFLPVASRREHVRFAAILGREGRYQLQLLAESPVSYTLTARDPSVPIEWGKEVEGVLPVGGAAFFSFKAKQGQLFEASLTSQKFMPVLQLIDQTGDELIGGGDDEGLEANFSHMVLSGGVYRLQVSSLGDGGGGDFRLALKETKLKELQIGGRGTGSVQPGATEFWAFAGDEGKTVFVNVRSESLDPQLSLHSPDGVLLASENKGDTSTGRLLAIKLPKSGKYVVGISSQRGAGEYSVRLIDGD